MTFTQTTKIELVALPLTSDAAALAELYGLILAGVAFDRTVIAPRLNIPSVRTRLQQLTERVTNSPVPLTDEVQRDHIFHKIGYVPERANTHQINFALLETTETQIAFLRGIFLLAGSVSSPDARSHLEIVGSHRRVIASLHVLQSELGLSMKEAIRRGRPLLYLKSAEQIADFLAALGAMRASLAFHEAKAERDLKGKVQRRVNCDSANVDKTLDAAQQQLEAIRRIEKRDGLESLPEILHQAALLRLMNPEASTRDLAELNIPPIGKSTMRYRLNRIIACAAKD